MVDKIKDKFYKYWSEYSDVLALGPCRNQDQDGMT